MDDDGAADETVEVTDNSDRCDGDKHDLPDGSGKFELHHLDVNQADSTLLITPDSETILIDTGNWRQDGQEVIDYLEEHNIERIDHLVATHAHADHIGGHAAVIERFETDADGIGTAYDSGVVHNTAIYDNYLDAVEEHDVELFEVEESDELPLDRDEITATVLNPPAGDSGADLHYNHDRIRIR